jgi:hypothetical protein
LIPKEEQNHRHVIAIVEDIDGVKPNQVGIVTNESEDKFEVRFIGNDITRTVSPIQVKDIDVFETGKKTKACSNKDDCENWGLPPMTKSKKRRKSGCQCFTEKICITCGVLKKRQTDFEKNRVGAKDRPTYRPHCKPCYARKKGKDADKKAKEEAQSKHSRGSIFKCPICEKVGLANINVKIVPDHDHKTGKIRGPLCDKCNTGLGRWDDDPEIFSRVIKWLEGREKK